MGRVALCASLVGIVSGSAWAGPISFSNVADDPENGLSYSRTPSFYHESQAPFWEDSVTTPKTVLDAFSIDFKVNGFPAVALLDADRDDDLDIYVTNGPGTPNSLFLNQLQETGSATFVDVGATSGADATDQDSNGACFGDLDNDGDDDLLVLGRHQPNRLFANDGSGRFTEVADSGLEMATESHLDCALGDVDGDGLLDVMVANVFDFSTYETFLGLDYFGFNESNALFKNLGSLMFTDVTVASGVLDLQGTDAGFANPPTMTWGISMVDVDRDGDLDIVQSDDQAVPDAHDGGADRGGVHILLNDGSGFFRDLPVIEALGQKGDMMGTTFGDLDCDGHLDFFVTNSGDYGAGLTGLPYVPGTKTSRWFLGTGDGTFVDDQADGRVGPFGWGSAVFDADNDGDQDIVYHGGQGSPLLSVEDNPGVLLENLGCSAEFVEHPDAFPTVDYNLGAATGVATGDLDQDGYVDLVTATDHEWPAGTLLPGTLAFDSVWDDTALFAFPMVPVDPEGTLFTWLGTPMLPGRLNVELNDAVSTGGSALLEAVGSVGLTDGGTVNRSGIGALFEFEPDGGPTVLAPVLGGSGHLSQSALEQHVGMASARYGTLDTHWPGGVANRLYRVRPGERLVIPEIPCDIAGPGDDLASYRDYRDCVTSALDDLLDASILEPSNRGRFLRSALRAWLEER